MRLPSTLPDETLYSRLVRSLTFIGLPRSMFLTTMFGNDRASIHPWLTSNLSILAENSGEDAKILFREQTLFPLFSFFLPHYCKRIYCDALALHSASRACQLTNFREYERITLKYCPMCARENMEMYGVTYWHLGHQIPGIEACYLHKIWLYHIPMPPRPHIQVELLPSLESHDRHCNFQAYAFANYSVSKLKAITKGEAEFTDYFRGFKNIGYITDAGRVRRKSIATALYRLASQITEMNNGLLPKSDDDYSYFSNLLKGKSDQHPFKHLLIGFFLEHVDLFCKGKIAELEYKKPDSSASSDKCKKLLSQGLSMAEASRRTGKSRCFIKALAIRSNISLNLRPRKITVSVKENILLLAQKGFHRKEIARRWGVSVGSVETLISSVPGLVNYRKAARIESKCRRHKIRIIRWLSEHPQAIRQQCRKECGAAFFWLYRHKPTWIENILPVATSPVQHRKVKHKL
ncbi:TniQ family protein [Escherichia coli]|nr:TniQ family protein [Escherichia coli]